MVRSRKKPRRAPPLFSRRFILIFGLVIIIGGAAVFFLHSRTERELLPEASISQPIPPAPSAEMEEGKPDEKAVPSRARLALIIDDGGYNLEALDEILRLGRPVTFAILPHAPHTRRAVRLAREGGAEVMLHLPMEPRESERYSLEKNTIRAGMDEAKILEILREGLQRVPGARGVNNHMGSRATEDRAVMQGLMKALKENGLYFVDSHTSPRTVGSQEARKIGVAAGENVRFMDHEKTLPAVKQAIRSAMKRAKQDGKAIAIGHPHAVTVQAIREMISEIEEEGIALVFASEVVG